MAGPFDWLFGQQAAAPAPGLLNSSGLIDEAAYDRARREQQMMGFWGQMAAGSAPSLQPRNFMSALGSGFGGFSKGGNEFDEAQQNRAAAALGRARVPGALADAEKARAVAETLRLAEGDVPRPPVGTGSPLPGARVPAADFGGGGKVGAPGGWGPHAVTAAQALSGAGMSEAATQGILANGLGEGGFTSPWVQSSVTGPKGREQSFGHWQFNVGGELPGYQAWAQGKGDLQDTRLQAQYVAKRMEELHPGFSQITDPKLATDLVATKFERYKGAAPGQRYGYLSEVQRAYAAGQPAAGAPATATAAPGITLPEVGGGRAAQLEPGAAPAPAIAAAPPPPPAAPAPAIAGGAPQAAAPRYSDDPALSEIAAGRSNQPWIPPQYQNKPPALSGGGIPPMGAAGAGGGGDQPAAPGGLMPGGVLQRPPAPMPPIVAPAGAPAAPAPAPAITGAPGAPAPMAPPPAMPTPPAAPPLAAAPAGQQLDPAWVRRQQLRALGLAAAGITVPQYIQEGAALGIAGQKAAAEAAARQPYQIQIEQLKALTELQKTEYAHGLGKTRAEFDSQLRRAEEDLKGGMQPNPQTGQMEARPGFSETQAAAAGAKQTAVDAATRTQDQKEYEFYAAQETASGRPVKSFQQFLTENKQAGATNITQKVEGQGQAAIINASIDAMKAAFKQEDQALARGQLYGQLAQAMEGFRPGATAEMRYQAGAFWKDIFGTDVVGVPSAEMFQQAAAKVQFMNVPKGEGAITGPERELIAKVDARLINSPEALMQMIEVGRRLDTYDRKVAQIHRDVAKEGGGLPNFIEAQQRISALGSPLSPGETAALERLQKREGAEAATPGAPRPGVTGPDGVIRGPGYTIERNR